MVVRLTTWVTLALLLSPGAAAQTATTYEPFLSQGAKRSNPLKPAPDRQREFVTPQFADPDPRDRAVVGTDLNKRRPRKLLPQDGDVRLRQQRGEFPAIPQLPPLNSK